MGFLSSYMLKSRALKYLRIDCLECSLEDEIEFRAQVFAGGELSDQFVYGADCEPALLLESGACAGREAVGGRERLGVGLDAQRHEQREELAAVADQHAVRHELRQRLLEA